MSESMIFVSYPKCLEKEKAPAFADINPLFVGYERCEKGHAFGPAIRSYYLIHFVSEGTGTLFADGRTWTVNSGEMFVIYPDEATSYAADLRHPWTYCWVAFDGRYAKRFDSAENRVYKVSDLYFNRIKELTDNCKTANADFVIALLYNLIYELFREEKNNADHVETIKNYIESNYMKDITVEQIARVVYLDRRYIGRKFKEKTGTTIQNYLISVRLANAAKFLSAGYSVTQSANMCGYRDVFNFSKIFKKHFNAPPKNYKKNG